MATPSPLELKEKFITCRSNFFQGKATEDELFSAADAYIEALKAFKKKTGAKLKIPTRAILIRAL